MPVRPAALLCLVALAACADIPRLPGVPEPGAEGLPPAQLVPLGPILAGAGPAPDAAAAAAPLAARAAALRARAGRLRGTLIDAGTRSRMETGVAIPARLR